MEPAEENVYARVEHSVRRAYLRAMLPFGTLAVGGFMAGLIGGLFGWTSGVVVLAFGSIVLLGLLTGGFVSHSMLIPAARQAVKREVRTPLELAYVFTEATNMAHTFHPVSAAILVAAADAVLKQSGNDMGRLGRFIASELDLMGTPVRV